MQPDSNIALLTQQLFSVIWRFMETHPDQQMLANVDAEMAGLKACLKANAEIRRRIYNRIRQREIRAKP